MKSLLNLNWLASKKKLAVVKKFKKDFLVLQLGERGRGRIYCEVEIENFRFTVEVEKYWQSDEGLPAAMEIDLKKYIREYYKYEEDVVLPTPVKYDRGKIMSDPNGALDTVCDFITADGGYKRGTKGFIKINPSKTKLLAKGQGAWGMAGRLGTWGEYLIEAAPGSLIEVNPSGRSEKYYIYYPGGGEGFEVFPEDIPFFIREYFGGDEKRFKEEVNKLEEI